MENFSRQCQYIFTLKGDERKWHHHFEILFDLVLNTQSLNYNKCVAKGLENYNLLNINF